MDIAQMRSLEKLSYEMLTEVLEKVFKDEGFNAVMQVCAFLGGSYEDSVTACEQQGWDAHTVRGVAAADLSSKQLGALHQQLIGLNGAGG
jgi:hypothetical protein